MIGQAFHWANLTVAFLLELCALAALGYWGLRTASGPAAKAALGIGAPLLAAVLWGLFAAPRAPVSIPLASGGVQLLVFGAAVAALYATGRHALALTFAVLVVANVVLLSPSDGERDRPKASTEEKPRRVLQPWHPGRRSTGRPAEKAGGRLLPATRWRGAPPCVSCWPAPPAPSAARPSPS